MTASAISLGVLTAAVNSTTIDNPSNGFYPLMRGLASGALILSSMHCLKAMQAASTAFAFLGGCVFQGAIPMGLSGGLLYTASVPNRL